MATILYRALDSNNDPLAGNGRGSYVSDLEAVAQMVSTRLKLLEGEWWENLSAGTPVFESILGVSGAGRNAQAVALVLTRRILGTPYVVGVSNGATSYNSAQRSFTFSCQVATQFGTLSVTNQSPGQAASLIFA